MARPRSTSPWKWLLVLSALAYTAVGGLMAQLFHRRVRWLTLPLALIAVGWAGCAWLHVPAAPGDTLSPEELVSIERALLTQVKEGGPNHSHARRLLGYAVPFATAEGASVPAVQAAALLHDATKERPTEDPKARFCAHGETGAQFARTTLAALGKSEAFGAHVGEAISQHMGPCGFDWGHLRRRFMSRFCDRPFPEPRSREARVLYDIDMLDLMTVDGVLKVVTLRQTGPEFGKEPLRDSALTGADSAWKSVEDAGATLLTRAARDCGDDLASHSRAFLDGVVWDEVKDLAAFAQAVRAYKVAHPIPECLPQ